MMAVDDIRAAKEPPPSGREISSLAAAELCKNISPRTHMVPL